MGHLSNFWIVLLDLCLIFFQRLYDTENVFWILFLNFFRLQLKILENFSSPLKSTVPCSSNGPSPVFLFMTSFGNTSSFEIRWTLQTDGYYKCAFGKYAKPQDSVCDLIKTQLILFGSHAVIFELLICCLEAANMCVDKRKIRNLMKILLKTT